MHLATRMKNQHLERAARLRRQYHRNRPWRLGPGGLYVPHSYELKSPDDLSWWDDVGFVAGGRRVIVWWQHPRHVYENAIEEQLWDEIGPGPHDDWLAEGSTRQYRRVGASRKKLVGYVCREPSPEQAQYYQRLREARKRLMALGVQCTVRPSWTRKSLDWATGVSLVAPLEVRNVTELAVVAELARRLLRGQTTLAEQFGEYHYGREDWLAEQAQLAARRAAQEAGDAA